MFQFLRTIYHHASPAHKLQCLQKYTPSISPKYMSIEADRHSFTVSYLMNSCGLPLESALSASKTVHFQTRHRPDSVLEFFKNHGFSKSQITTICSKTPEVLTFSLDKTLLPKVEFFQSLGISSSELAKMLSLCPYILRNSLENQIIPSFSSLSDLLQSREKAISLIKGYSYILFHNARCYLLPNVKVLRDLGVPQSNIARLIYSWPKSILSRLKSFEKSVAAVKEMGINPLRIQFVVAIVAISRLREEHLERKFSIYKSWGWSEEEIRTTFQKCPWIMVASDDKIMALMDFLVNQMGWEPSVIRRRPVLVTLSLEKRIIPRCAVLQFLLSKGLIKESTNFSTLLTYTEKLFLHRCVNSFDEAPQLLKLYVEKLNSSPPKKKRISIR